MRTFNKICTLLVVLILLTSPLVLQSLRVKSPSPVQQSESHVIKVWLVLGFEGDGGSVVSWLKNCARTHEKNNPKTFIEVSVLFPDEISVAIKSPEESLADIVIFSPGQIKRDAFEPLSSDVFSQIRLDLLRIANKYAVPLFYAPYTLLSDEEILLSRNVLPWQGNMAEKLRLAASKLKFTIGKKKKTTIKAMALGQEGFYGGGVALLESQKNLNEMRGVLPNALDIFSSKIEAYDAFAKGKFGMLLGSPKDVFRTKQREKKGKHALYMPLVGSNSYTDLVYFASVTPKADEAAQAFILALLSQGFQQNFASMGFEGASRQIQSSILRKTRWLIPDAFTSAEDLRLFGRAATDFLQGKEDGSIYKDLKAKVLRDD